MRSSTQLPGRSRGRPHRGAPDVAKAGAGSTRRTQNSDRIVVAPDNPRPDPEMGGGRPTGAKCDTATNHPAPVLLSSTGIEQLFCWTKVGDE